MLVGKTGLALLLGLVLAQDSKLDAQLPAEVTRIFGAFDRHVNKVWERVPVPGETPLAWPGDQRWRADPTRASQFRLTAGIRVDSQAAGELTLLRTRERYRFNLLSGEMLFDIGFTSGQAPEEQVEIVLPNGTVVVPSSTKAFVRVLCRVEKGKDHVAVLNGEVRINSGKKDVSMKHGEGADLGPKIAELKPKKEDVLSQAAWTRWEEKQRAKKNLIVDGDMEGKGVTWSLTNVVATKDLREAAEGRQSLKIAPGPSEKGEMYAQQTFAVKPKMRFRLTGWAKSGCNRDKKPYVQVSYVASVGKGQTPVVLYEIQREEWYYFEVEESVPKDAHSLNLCLVSAGKVCYYDMLVFTAQD